MANHTDDYDQRLELSRAVNHQIFKLAEAAKRLTDDEDHPIFHGIMSRIQTLSEVLYYAQRMNDKDEGDIPDLRSLERTFNGMLQ